MSLPPTALDLPATIHIQICSSPSVTSFFQIGCLHARPLLLPHLFIIAAVSPICRPSLSTMDQPSPSQSTVDLIFGVLVGSSRLQISRSASDLASIAAATSRSTVFTTPLLAPASRFAAAVVHRRCLSHPDPPLPSLLLTRFGQSCFRSSQPTLQIRSNLSLRFLSDCVFSDPTVLALDPVVPLQICARSRHCSRCCPSSFLSRSVHPSLIVQICLSPFGSVNFDQDLPHQSLVGSASLISCRICLIGCYFSSHHLSDLAVNP